MNIKDIKYVQPYFWCLCWENYHSSQHSLWATYRSRVVPAWQFESEYKGQHFTLVHIQAVDRV